MKMTNSVFIATSLDGCIARQDGAIDWLPVIGESGAGEDFSYALVGRGIPLFGPLCHDVNLRPRESRQIGGGVVQSSCEVV